MVENTMQDSTTKDLTITRVMNAPVEKVWNAWNESEQVMRWWGPTGFTCPVAEMNVHVGGVSLVCMRAPKEWGGQDMYNTWTYTVVEPTQLLEYTVHFSDKDGNPVDPATQNLPPGMPGEVPHVVTFKALDDNTTEVTITEYGYTSDQMVELSRAGMNQCFDKMAAMFAGE